MSKTVGLIGFGAIAQDLVELLSKHQETTEPVILTRPGRQKAVSERASELGLSAGFGITDSLTEFLGADLDVVAECAGHQAVHDCGDRILESGIDLIIASVGALADAILLDKLKLAARRGGSQIIVPSGAIGGIDALSAARHSDLTSVIYTGRKPPLAWLGTPAEKTTDLYALNEPETIFEGNAREAAKAYPKNANVAATLALAGMGMEATQVRLIADPLIDQNQHEFSFSSPAIEATIRLVGKPSPRNPKTSQSTALSIARAVINHQDILVI